MPNMPDRMGHFGVFGGRYVAETLMPALLELDTAYRRLRRDKEFQREVRDHLREYAGRETPLYLARRLTERLGGAKIYLKREDLCHTGAHKINNTIGQGLLARRMGKQRIIAETGAGQHGVATATVTALLGMPCEVFMGAEDVQPPVAQRLPHEAARRPGARGGERQRDAEGRGERGAARLGDQRAHDLLPGRLDHGAASLPDDRARLPVGDRQRDQASDPQARRAPARIVWSPASAAAATRWGCSIRSSRSPASR